MNNSKDVARRADVALIHDGSGLRRKAAAMLGSAFRVIEQRFVADEPPKSAGALAPVLCLSRIQSEHVFVLERRLAGYAARPIFLFPTFSAENLDRAKALGGKAFVAPLEPAAILQEARKAINGAVEASWNSLKPSETAALKASVASFQNLFRSSVRGERMPMDAVHSACDSIQGALVDSSVDRWLGSLRQHHDTTFRHSMFVCGSLAYFCHSIGIRGDDLKELTVGGFVHDAGKARIPLEILDKPGKLDDAEWAIMKTHPEHSRELLMAESGLTADIVAMAVSHHEKLDGSGYPDNLKDGQLNDFVRLTSIADVFSALTEPRAYKEPMSNEQALDIMAGFKGHLDLALVRRFREYIQDSTASLAA